MPVRSTLQSAGRYLRTLFTNRFFYGGLAVLVVLGAVGYWLFDSVLMPAYTRQSVTVIVPDVRNMPVDAAQQTLRLLNLRPETEAVRRLKPNVPLDAVVDQNPEPNVPVKYGRRVYLTVNSGSTPEVPVPDVTSLSHREARNQLEFHGFKVIELRDPEPSPFRGVVTRIDPPAGTVLRQGETVRIFYSTGLGSVHVTVPDLTGMTIAEARDALTELKLRYNALSSDRTRVIVAAVDTVARQGTAPGTSVRQGFEIRLFVD